MTICYFVLGDNLDLYVQAHFSILSFKKQLQDNDHIVVVTTNPEYLAHYPFVECITIDKTLVDEWQGKHKFFWRAKIKAIEMVAQRYADSDLLYLDCDTFLYSDFESMKLQLAEGKGFMDGNEGHPSTIKTKPQRMYKKIGGKTYGGITISEKHNMWCAGVVGIPADKKQSVVATALQLCDGMLDDKAEPIVVEQYSLSIAMFENLSLQSSKPFIAHYWSNKKQWVATAKELFIKSLFTSADVQSEIREFEKISIDEIPVYKKSHISNTRLKKLADKIFGDTDIKYITKQ